MGSPTQGHLHDARRAPERFFSDEMSKNGDTTREKMPYDGVSPSSRRPLRGFQRVGLSSVRTRAAWRGGEAGRVLHYSGPHPGGAVRRLLCLACLRGQPCCERKCYKSHPRACVWGGDSLIPRRRGYARGEERRRPPVPDCEREVS